MPMKKLITIAELEDHSIFDLKKKTEHWLTLRRWMHSVLPKNMQDMVL